MERIIEKLEKAEKSFNRLKEEFENGKLRESTGSAHFAIDYLQGFTHLLMAYIGEEED